MSANDSADTELWLVHVPRGFDVSALNKLNTNVFGPDGNTQKLKVKIDQEKSFYSVSASREVTDYRKTFTMVTGADGQASLGRELLNTLTVTQTAAPAEESTDSVDSAFPVPVPAPASRVCMPAGLRQRFTPFGADTPCPSVSRKKKKIKKERAWKDEESMEEEVGQDVRKSSKKRKREENLNHHEEEPEVKREEEVQDTKKSNKKRKREENLNHHDEEIQVKREEEVQDPKKSRKKRKREENLNHHEEEPEVKREEEVCEDPKKSSKKRKREESPDRCEEEPEKKKRKSKHRHSESVDLHNGDTGNTLSSPTKHKRRHSEGTIQTRSVNDLFVIDTTGDQRLGKDNVSDSNKKHKKSKKHKKHRQTM